MNADAKNNMRVMSINDNNNSNDDDDNSLRKQEIPPEIVFFGDPRQPLPVEASRDPKYHGSLLYWARHATVAPRNSQDR